MYNLDSLVSHVRGVLGILHNGSKGSKINALRQQDSLAFTAGDDLAEPFSPAGS